jgi:hypothetical protein
MRAGFWKDLDFSRDNFRQTVRYVVVWWKATHDRVQKGIRRPKKRPVHPQDYHCSPATLHEDIR